MPTSLKLLAGEAAAWMLQTVRGLLVAAAAGMQKLLILVLLGEALSTLVLVLVEQMGPPPRMVVIPGLTRQVLRTAQARQRALAPKVVRAEHSWLEVLAEQPLVQLEWDRSLEAMAGQEMARPTQVVVAEARRGLVGSDVTVVMVLLLPLLMVLAAVVAQAEL